MKLTPFLVCTFSVLLAARAEPPPRRGGSNAASVSPRLGVLSLKEVTRSALVANPSIKAVRAKWEMMKARIPQAAAWDDPMFGVDVERSGTTKLNTFTDNEWMLSQKIPIAGKNRSRARAASAEALATIEELRRRQLDVVAKARGAYFKLANAFAQLDVNRRNESLLTQFTEISRAKYEVGTQTQADVLIAETDLIRLIETRRDLERDLSDAQTALNVLMNRPARAPLGRPAELTFKPAAFAAGRIEGLALANRPELQMAEQKIAAEEARLEAARRDWIPEPQLRLEARQFKDRSKTFQEYDTGIFFNIPWGNHRKYSAQVSEMRSSVEMATRDLESARTEAIGLVRDQLKKIETFHHHVELFRDRLLPAARQTVEATRAGYESDKSGFLDLIVAQRGVRDIESTYYRHLADYQMALAELEAIVGADLRIFPLPTRTLPRTGK